MTMANTSISVNARNTIPKIPIIILGIWLLIAIFAPWIAPWPQSEMVGTPFGPLATGDTLLGTDYFGRDLLSRVLYGSRTTLSLALSANVIASVIGITVGFLAAYCRGWIDEIISRIMDGLFSFPTMMFALICVSAFGSSNIILILTVGFIESIRVFRVARAVAMDNLARDYVDLARLRGESTAWILFREVLPNAYPPLLTDFGVRFSGTVMLLSAISFLGLGVQPPLADWGMMTRENLAGLRTGSLAPLIPALAIFSVTFATNQLVDWFLKRTQHDISSELIG